jgi:sugar lactone lactonase YvrE
MSSEVSRPRIISVQPIWALEGGRITLQGNDLSSDSNDLPEVWLGEIQARVVFASRNAVSVIVPVGLKGGHTPVRTGGSLGETAFVDVGIQVATGLCQVDNPVFDQGDLYLTYSGARGENPAVSVFRVRRDGFREPFLSGITNATSMAFSPDRRLYISSRFQGTVYCVEPDHSLRVIASELGVPCGLAFSPDGTLYVGDRSGTVFRIDTAGSVTPFAKIPTSVAAFHLAWGPDDALYVSAPTMSSYDSIYRIDYSGQIDKFSSGFGRPQGIAFDSQGMLYVVEALAGVSGLCRVESNGSSTRILAAAALVGLAFDPDGGLVVVSNEAAYRLDLAIRPY